MIGIDDDGDSPAEGELYDAEIGPERPRRRVRSEEWDDPTGWVGAMLGDDDRPLVTFPDRRAVSELT